MSDENGDNPPPPEKTSSGGGKDTKQEEKAPPPTEATTGTKTEGSVTEESTTEESETEDPDTEESDTESTEEKSAKATETGKGEDSTQEDEVLPPDEPEDVVTDDVATEDVATEETATEKVAAEGVATGQTTGQATEQTATTTEQVKSAGTEGVVLADDKTAAEGGWNGENGLYLNPRDNAAADGFMEKAKGAEASITPVVMDIRDNVPGAETVGYPKDVLKTEDSFKRKLATELEQNPDMDVDEALGNMKDSVRYTMQFPDEGTSYADGVNTAMQRLTDAGMEPVDFRNTWGESGYQGINSWWQDPATGHTFEMQFHTPESFAAKMETHDLYKQQRLPGVTPEQRAELQQQQDQIFDAVPRPTGASSIRPPDKRRE
jgi:hypothetical protein